MTAVAGHSPGGTPRLLNFPPTQNLPLGNHVFAPDAIDLVVHVDAGTDMVRNDPNLVADCESSGRFFHAEMSMLFRKIDNLYLGILDNISEAHVVSGEEPIAGEGLGTPVDHSPAGNSVADDGSKYRNRTIIVGRGLASNRVFVIEDIGSRSDLGDPLEQV